MWRYAKKFIILKPNTTEPYFYRVTDMNILKVLPKFIFRECLIFIITTTSDIPIITSTIKITAVIATIFKAYYISGTFTCIISFYLYNHPMI